MLIWMLHTNEVSIELVLTPISRSAAQNITAVFHSECSLSCSGSALTISVLDPGSLPPDLVIFHISVKNKNKQAKKKQTKAMERIRKGFILTHSLGGYHPSWGEGTAAAV